MKGLPTALYRIFDADDRLLYVGVTDDLRDRMRAHAESKPWWDDETLRVEVTWFTSRPAALDAEAVAIRVEQPIYNRTNRARSAAWTHENWRPSSPEQGAALKRVEDAAQRVIGGDEWESLLASALALGVPMVVLARSTRG